MPKSANLVSERTQATHLGSAKDPLALVDGDMQWIRFAWEFASAGLLLTDPTGQVLAANPAYGRLYGLTPDEIQGRNLAAILPEEARAGAMARYAAIFRSDGAPDSYEAVVRRADGSEIVVEARTAFAVRDGKRVAMITVVHDISGRKRHEQQLIHDALHDQLTGLPNRRLFQDRLQQALGRAHRRSEGGALFIIDLDDFKPINDEYGHQAGDLVLQEVARRLSSALRQSDTVARIGGDEFAVLIEGCDAESSVELVAKKVLDEIRAPISLAGLSVSVTASLGIALYPSQGHTAELAVQVADRAMYQAKRNGLGYSLGESASRAPRKLSRAVAGRASS